MGIHSFHNSYALFLTEISTGHDTLLLLVHGAISIKGSSQILIVLVASAWCPRGFHTQENINFGLDEASPVKQKKGDCERKKRRSSLT